MEAVINPATEETLTDVPHATTGPIWTRRLPLPKKGFETWRKTPALNRQKIIAKAADILEADIDNLARNLTMEMGKPLGGIEDRAAGRHRHPALVWRGGQTRLWPDRAGPSARHAPDGDKRADRRRHRLRRLELPVRERGTQRSAARWAPAVR